MNTLLIVIIVVFVVALYLSHKSDELTDQRKQEKEEKELKDRENSFRQTLLDEVKRQAEMVDDADTLKAIEDGTYDGPMPQKHGIEYESIYPDNLLTLSIAGINYRGNLKNYVGPFDGVLKPEPTNDYDPDAIMVKCSDGKHLGYVPENMTWKVREMLGKDFTTYRIKGQIYEREDYDDNDRLRHYFVGIINIVKPLD